MFQVTKDTTISDVMENAPETIRYFRRMGMNCMGCAMANGETVQQACMVHDVNVDEFIARLNAYIKGKPQ